jgi:hypothetical protein
MDTGLNILSDSDRAQKPEDNIPKHSNSENDKKCQKCGFLNPFDYSFCIYCGTEFMPPEKICSNCGQLNSLEFSFCVNCGADIHNIQPAPQLEDEIAPQIKSRTTQIEPEKPEIELEIIEGPEDDIKQVTSGIEEYSKHTVTEELSLIEEDTASLDDTGQEEEAPRTLRVSFETMSGTIREIELKDSREDGWTSESKVIEQIWKLVETEEHYDWFKAIKQVEPNNIEDRERILLTIKFKENAENPFNNTLYHILLEANTEKSEFTCIGINTPVTEEVYYDCINLIINNSDQIRQLTLWVKLDYKAI